MQLLSDSLLIQGTESHQLVMIEPLTGSVRRRMLALSVACTPRSIHSASRLSAPPRVVASRFIPSINLRA